MEVYLVYLYFQFIEDHSYFSGLVLSHPAEIDAKENVTAHYEKRSNTATGSAFMLTYDIIESTGPTKEAYAKVTSSDLSLIIIDFNLTISSF